MLLPALLLVVLQVSPDAPPPPQEAVDPALRTAVERFFATQQTEDVQAYLALWSSTAVRPPAHQLAYIFESGDDRFTDLVIERASVIGTQARVRVRVSRTRIDLRAKRPDGSPAVYNSRLEWALTFVREGDDWKLLREGAPVDELALALLAAKRPEERKALIGSDPDLVNERLLDAMSRRGDGEAQKNAYPAALVIYSRVLEVARLIGDPKGEGRALQNTGNAYYFLRDYRRALEAFEQRLALETGAGNEEGTASALAGIGSVRYALFEYGDSLAAYRQAVAILEKLDDKLSLAAVLISTGNVLYIQGDLEGAIADYTRSRNYYRAAFYQAGEARALEGLGRCYSTQGNLAAALEAYGGLLEEGAARNDPRGQATALFNIGEIHLRLANLEIARELFDRSRGFYEQMKDLANAGRSWQGVALTELVAARYAASEQAYGKSQETCTAGGDLACVARATVGLAFAQSSQDQFDNAVATYGRAIASFTQLAARAESAADRRALTEEGARAELGLSRALDGKEDHRAALAAASRAWESAARLGSADVSWRALVAQARALRRMNEPAVAKRVAADAVATIERMRHQALERPDLRVPGDAVEALALFAVLQAEAGNASAAAETAEARRALALRLALANNEREIHRGMTDEERAEERTLAGALVALHLQRDREQGLPKPDPVRLARLHAALVDASAKRSAHQQRLFERFPDLRRWRGLEPPAPPADAQARVISTPGTVLLQFVVDEDDLVVMTAVASESGPLLASHLVPIARRKLAERVAALSEAASLKDGEAWRKVAAGISSLVPPTVWKLVNASRALIVIPDDVLWRVPFDALVVEDRYLADVATVACAGSIAALRAERAAGTAPVLLVAAGAPDVSAPVRDRLKVTAPDWTLRAADAAEREIEVAAAPYTDPLAATLLASVATEDALRADAERAAVLHLALPFRANSASPLFSPMLLTTPAVAKPESAADGVLEAREIMNLTLRARIAVLTDGMALSMRNAAGAAPALHWTWLAAGVPAIVLPRWVSDDAAGRVLVAEFHARLRAGAAPAVALRAARLKVRSHEATAAPFYWAGWMLLGR